MLTTSAMRQSHVCCMILLGLRCRNPALLGDELRGLGLEDVERLVEILVIADREPMRSASRPAAIPASDL